MPCRRGWSVDADAVEGEADVAQPHVGEFVFLYALEQHRCGGQALADDDAFGLADQFVAVVFFESAARPEGLVHVLQPVVALAGEGLQPLAVVGQLIGAYGVRTTARTSREKAESSVLQPLSGAWLGVTEIRAKSDSISVPSRIT